MARCAPSSEFSMREGGMRRIRSNEASSLLSAIFETRNCSQRADRKSLCVFSCNCITSDTLSFSSLKIVDHIIFFNTN